MSLLDLILVRTFFFPLFHPEHNHNASSYTLFATALLGGGVGYGGTAVLSVGCLPLTCSFGDDRGQGLLAGCHHLGCRVWLTQQQGILFITIG